MKTIEIDLQGHMHELAASLEFLASRVPIFEWNLKDLEEKFARIALAHARFTEGELEEAREILDEIIW